MSRHSLRCSPSPLSIPIFFSLYPALLFFSLTFSMPERVCWFQGQSYHKLKRACLQRGKLFKDPLFPPSALSLFYKRAPPPGLTWKRPRVSGSGMGRRGKVEEREMG